ncbi:MAG: PIN domain-containing protein [Micrococcales bacterium]|nr:PIN domain-containing protein [Micrococcales bacterium]
MRYYLDSSILLHALLPGGNKLARSWLDSVLADGAALFSSKLLRLETARALRREGLPTKVAEAVLVKVALVSLDDAVLKVAELIEPHVKSLDAIHLATLIQVDQAAALVTSDRTLSLAARQLGINCLNPL